MNKEEYGIIVNGCENIKYSAECEGCGKEGTKHDTEKTRLDLIPCEALEQIGRGFTYGAVKYGAHNYRKGVDYSRLYSAALRHLNAFWGGEDIDGDSGLPHLALAGAEICMLIAMDAECDDRYKKEVTDD